MGKADGFWSYMETRQQERTKRQDNRQDGRSDRAEDRQENRTGRSVARNQRKETVQTARAETGTNLGGTLTQRSRTKAALALGLAGKTEASVAMAQGGGTFGNAGGGYVEGGAGGGGMLDGNGGLLLLGGLAIGAIALASSSKGR